MARISKEKQIEIRRSILDVSKELFGTVGFEKTSTKEIAKRVGIAEGTLFNYFDSKTELFFETFGEEYRLLNETNDIAISEDITDALFEHFDKNLAVMLKIPRGVLSELMVASVRMAKRKPDRFRKLIELDLAFINEIRIYIDQLIELKILKPVDSKNFAEIIYSILGYELILYVYDKSIKKDQLVTNIKSKMDILINGYKN